MDIHGLQEDAIDMSPQDWDEHLFFILAQYSIFFFWFSAPARWSLEL